MPLKVSSTRSAFTANLERELAAGKPRKVALAIAFEEARKARAKGK